MEQTFDLPAFTRSSKLNKPGRSPSIESSLSATAATFLLQEIRGGGEMTGSNSQSDTNVHEISVGIYRMNTPVVLKNGNTFIQR
jgi:hypothetical protein